MIMLIDARNCVYRAVYASEAEHNRDNKRRKKHPLLIMLRQIGSWIRDHKPSVIQVFWDAPRDTVWRKRILATYKQRDPNCHWIKDLAEDLDKTQKAARDVFQHLGVYQFYKARMEADDLIYAACKLQHNSPMMIFSSDSDMLQIPYTFSSVRLYDPERRAEIQPPAHNPILQKILMGDFQSDKIPGYPGIGPKKSLKLIQDLHVMEQFLRERGRDIFLRNMMLIDLAMCPYLPHNQVYVSRVLGTHPAYSKELLLQAAQRHQVHGILDEFADVAVPFRKVSVASHSILTASDAL